MFTDSAMTLNLSLPESSDLRPRIVVFGVGGAGGNAVNNMIESKLAGVDFVVANTDSQALTRSSAEQKVQMGAAITQGLGAGARPEVGEQSAEESNDEIREHLAGAHMVFITAGMGGGTGTGAAPVVAKIAREMGILTVGVVTKPFHFEGTRRMKLAEGGIDQLQDHVDTLIIIPNQNLFRIATEKTTFAEAFSMADQVLHSGVRGITDLMVMPGLINLDFADVRAVMNEMGKAMMGTGEASGEKRAVEASQAAISNPLLDDVSMKGATGVLINITGGYDMTLYEVDEAANEIRSEVDSEANIIVGSTFDENMDGTMRVSVVATGIEAEAALAADPRNRARGAAPVERTPNDAILPWKRLNNERPGRVNVEAPAEIPTADIPATLDTSAPTPASDRQSEMETAAETAPAEPYVAPIEVASHVEAERQSPAPQIHADQARLAAEAQTLNERYLERREAEARRAPSVPASAALAPEKTEKPKRGGFSLFGRRRKIVEPTPVAPTMTQPVAAPVAPPVAPTLPADTTPRPPTGDLFGASLDEGDLEIPAFLRRQAN
jgi:cell division protein FtsZ